MAATKYGDGAYNFIIYEIHVKIRGGVRTASYFRAERPPHHYPIQDRDRENESTMIQYCQWLRNNYRCPQFR